jgi:hypothetical protein
LTSHRSSIVNESLLAFYRLGTFVLETDPASVHPTTGRRAKGSFERIQKTKRRGRNELAKARRFAQLYNSAKLKWICSLGQQNGRPLTKSHVCRLVVVSNAQKRDRLARKCARHEWSVLRLEFEIQRIQPRRAYGGRQLKRPQSAVDALAETQRQITRWIRWAEVTESASGDRTVATGMLPRELQRLQLAVTTKMKMLQRGIQRHLSQKSPGTDKKPRQRQR